MLYYEDMIARNNAKTGRTDAKLSQEDFCSMFSDPEDASLPDLFRWIDTDEDDSIDAQELFNLLSFDANALIAFGNNIA